MCVDETNFRRCDSGILQFHGGALLTAQDDDVCTFHPDGAGASFDCFKRIFDLEDVAVGTVIELLAIESRLKSGM